MKGLTLTKAQIDEMNEKRRIEGLAFAAMTPDERTRHMQSKAAGKKSPIVMDEFKRLGLIIEKQNDNQPRPEIPNAEQPEHEKALAGNSGREAQSPRGVSKGPGRGFCSVSILLRRCSLLDVDAAYSSVKDVLDCCWRSGLVDGDRPDQIRLEVGQEKVSSKKEEGTLITVEIP